MPVGCESGSYCLRWTLRSFLGFWRVLGVWSVWRVLSLLGVSGLASGKLGRPLEAIDVALGCLLAEF